MHADMRIMSIVYGRGRGESGVEKKKEKKGGIELKIEHLYPSTPPSWKKKRESGREGGEEERERRDDFPNSRYSVICRDS